MPVFLVFYNCTELLAPFVPFLVALPPFPGRHLAFSSIFWQLESILQRWGLYCARGSSHSLKKKELCPVLAETLLLYANEAIGKRSSQLVWGWLQYIQMYCFHI